MKNDINYAIDTIDINLLKNALHGHPTLNNKNCKNNTMNRAIRAMLNTSPDKFDLNFFVELVKGGAKMSNDCRNSSLKTVLDYASQYMLAKKSTEHNINKLINFLIENGAKVSNHQDCQLNTLTHAINTKNVKIIKMIAELKPMPDNATYSLRERNTLTCAVITNNPEIVRIAIKCGSLPQNSDNRPYVKNTFDYAILTNNAEILKEIIIVGARPNNDDIRRDCSFCLFYNSITKLDSDCDNVINLLMCSGAIIPDYLFYVMNFLNKTDIDLKLLDCYDLLNKSQSAWNDPSKRNRLKKLIETLQCTMNDLVMNATGDCPNRKQKLVEICSNIPTCCVNIIYEYQCTIPKFNVIDWKKFIL